jgi:signal transduction histidine kinase
MNAMIQDLLVYSQLSNDENAVTSVHLDEDFETAITMLRSSIQDSGAVITHDPLPVVRVDRGQTVRLFQNLLGNALKFRKRDELPRIHVSAELGKTSGSFACGITESASTRSTSNAYSSLSSGSTGRSIPAQESALQHASALSNDSVDGSELIPTQATVLASGSRFPQRKH